MFFAQRPSSDAPIPVLFPDIGTVKVAVTGSLEGIETVALAGVVSSGLKVTVKAQVLFGPRFALLQ